MAVESLACGRTHHELHLATPPVWAVDGTRSLPDRAVTGHVQSAVTVERSLGTLRVAALVRLDDGKAPVVAAAVDGRRRKPEAR